MNKISKGKAVGLLSLGLASVALGSVGFASWVISTTNVNDTENVTVTVGAISDQRITITAALNTGDPSVTLDAKDTQKLGPIKGSGNTAEDLTFKVDVTGKSGAEYGSDTYSCKFAVAFPEAIKDGSYVTVKSVTGSGISGENYATGFNVPVSTTGEVTTYTFELKWGAKFGNKNPADLTESDFQTLHLDLDTVIADLRKVQNAFSGENKIQVTLSSAAAA